MVVGLGTIEIYLPNAHSLKDKRGIVKSVIQRLGNKFNVSVCELGKHDVWKNAVIGLACVSKDKEMVDRTFSAIEEFLEGLGDFQIICFEVEII